MTGAVRQDVAEIPSNPSEARKSTDAGYPGRCPAWLCKLEALDSCMALLHLPCVIRGSLAFGKGEQLSNASALTTWNGAALALLHNFTITRQLWARL